jgi:hypothetical protein
MAAAERNEMSEVEWLTNELSVSATAVAYYMERLAAAEDDVGLAERPGHPVTLTLDHACDCCGAILPAGADVAHFDGEEPEDTAIMHWGPCPEPDLWFVDYRSWGPEDECEHTGRHHARPYEEAHLIATRMRALPGVLDVKLVRKREEARRG